MLRVMLAGGGTAGHVNPALAIAEIIKENYPDAEICFAGNPDKLEAKLVPKAGYKFEPLKIEGFQRKINAENIKRNFQKEGSRYAFLKRYLISGMDAKGIPNAGNRLRIP